MVREVTVVFDDRYLVRKWGVKCSECGLVGACVDEYETRKVKEAHEDFHKHPSRISLTQSSD